MPSIKTKKQFYELYESGFFGNKPKTWRNLEEIEKSGYKGTLTIRSKVGMARKKVKYLVPVENVKKELEELKSLGFPESDFSFSQYVPDDKLTIQGELMLSDKGLYLLYSQLKTQMNTALKEESKQAEGLQALFLLKKYLNPQSLEDLNALLELYPDSIIEFSAYECNLGNLKGRNTLIWEVRNY